MVAALPRCVLCGSYCLFLNIAFYSHYFTPEIGAPSARIQDLSREWIGLGHSVQVVTCFPNHPFGRLYPGYRRGFYLEETLEKIQVHRHWTYVARNEGIIKKSLGHLSYLPSAALLSQPRLKPYDVAIASSPTFFAALAGLWGGRRRRVPFIMEIRDLWPAIFVDLGIIKNRRVIGWLERLEMGLYRKAAHIVTVTHAFRRNLISRGISGEKISVVPNGADVDFWQPVEDSASLRRELGLPPGFLILYLGAHGISHALGKILEAAEILRGQPGIQFLFVGEGAEKKKLFQEAQRRRLLNVHFFDPVKKGEVKKFYGAADVGLVPLRKIPLFQTFVPSKMFEIMAMGRPIIGSVQGEAAQILQQSGGALVVQPEDAKGIAESILRLYQDENEGRTLGKRGRRFVVENYSRRSLARQYFEIVRGAIGNYKEGSGCGF